MYITGAMLVRNEADRYLRASLESIAWCDRIVILDDASTDSTPEICRSYADVYVRVPEPLFTKNELLLRKRLWSLATQKGGWVLIVDADELLEPKCARAIRPLLQGSPLVKWVSFRLFDMWSLTHYREDNYWNAHTKHWPMMFLYDPSKTYVWREQPVHCGRYPLNAIEGVGFTTNLRIKHMGWARPEDRRAKYERYKAHDPEWRYGRREQYESILDEAPNLVEYID